MQVYGDIRTKIDINPMDVIDKLINEAIGDNTWVEEKDGKFYKITDSGGSHSYEYYEEIDRKTYDYVMSLFFIKTNYNAYFKKVNYEP